jgi:hypothetical protein
MLIFMFYSIFSYNFACYIGETTFFATKVLLFSHIRKRETHFFYKKSQFASFRSFFRFFLQLSLEQTTGLYPIYSEANYHLQFAPRAIYYPPATLPPSTTVDIRLIYGTYTVDTRYISIGIP